MAARLFEEASGYKQSVIATAQGDAARFRQILGEYERAPQVTRERMYLETMQQILGATSKVIVDQKGGQNLLYLPLDKLLQQSAQASAGTTVIPSAAPEASAPAATEPVQSRREGMRSRDREGGR